MKQGITALSLFSGGLDSVLAARLVAEQGIRVIGIKFVSPFFEYQILKDIEGYQQKIRELYGLDVVVEDITADYLAMLYKPRHGFGKNFNPCVDCKVLMVKKAKALMEKYGASFLISGEVLGQRPMSQRRDTLNVIERDSACKDILLRPLSALLMPPVRAERDGLVQRDRLLDFSGRGRSRQLALARRYGIEEIPAPGGGCRLTDPILSRRIALACTGEFIFTPDEMNHIDFLCLMTGRQFLLPEGGWLALGRNQIENEDLTLFCQPGDVRICMVGHPGPTALLRRCEKIYADSERKKKDILNAAALVVRYAKKVDGKQLPQVVAIHDGNEVIQKKIAPAAGESWREWMLTFE